MPVITDILRDGQQAGRDELTATFNRGYFLNALETERQLALEAGQPFVVCLVDIDQLRNVNAQYGQRVGNTVLSGLADQLRAVLDLPQWQNLRCLPARHDGDSLILLLPGCRLQRAEQFAQVLGRRIAGAVFAGGVRITVSIAVTAFSAGDTVDGLLTRAEQTLHLAKQFGTDSIETAPTPELKRGKASITRLPVAWQGTGPSSGRS